MAMSPLWVFGYGSLIWHPGFPVADRQIARLRDYHRSFCMRSIHHRGTESEPGLVLALDEAPGAACEGVAFRVEPGAEAPTLDYLRERELVSAAYLEKKLEIRMQDGRLIEALTYVIDPHHVQYCGGLPLEEQAAIIARATGGRGPNSDYLLNTVKHLQDLGIVDEELSWLSRRVSEILTTSKP